MKLACESIDRVLTTEIRLPFLTRGIIPAEYEAARAKIGGPISYAMASAILKCLEEGKNRVAVFTGVYHPENFPNGESDGPLGAAVVGNAIEKLGGDVTYCLEKETIPGTVHILGDKTRMEALSREKNAFIRPSPSAGSLGGVARKTRETIVLCEAAGFDTIFVETVGVGQSETAVHSMVDFFLLIQLAGTGDELQGIKRGIMEMADGIIINKADGDNLEKAKLAAAQFRNALHLFPAPESGWSPKVLTYSGYYNLGIKEIWDMVGEYMEFTQKNGYFNYKRNEQAKYWMYESINDTLRETFYHNPAVEKMLNFTEQQVLNNEISSFVAAKRMMDLFLENLSAKK